MVVRLTTVALAVLLCAACSALSPGGIPEPITIVEPSATVAPTAAPLLVHVVGAVAQPGVYRLAPEARLLDAIQAAGGALPDADLERINLADRARDGLQVYVPYRGTPSPPSLTPVGPGGKTVSAALVNINTATAAELDSLPGIGQAYAERIIAYRQALGPFKSIDELMQVPGIGPGTYDKVKSLITVQ